MSLAKNQRPHIGIFGKRNVGKSSIINTISGQNIAIVDKKAGTTTDPVAKSFELTGFGPVVLIDTAGIDDLGEVGAKRVQASIKKIEEIDLGIIVLADNNWSEDEDALLTEFKKYKLPFIVIYNKADLFPIEDGFLDFLKDKIGADVLEFSTLEKHDKNNLADLVELLKKNLPESVFQKDSLIGDLVGLGSRVLLITPIDQAAPAGRLILPQVQVIRDALDNSCLTTIIKEDEIEIYKAANYPKPDLIITDSQVFDRVDKAFASEIALTSFSILLARFKGPFDKYLEGTPFIEELKDGDNILILESCSHHVSCGDIGRDKIPNWLRKYTGKDFHFDVVAGLDSPPQSLESYNFVIQCGGCMLTHKQLANRLQKAIDLKIPVSNYGLVISYCLGIFDRATRVFKK